jgi:hypothetical protein
MKIGLGQGTDLCCPLVRAFGDPCRIPERRGRLVGPLRSPRG